MTTYLNAAWWNETFLYRLTGTCIICAFDIPMRLLLAFMNVSSHLSRCCVQRRPANHAIYMALVGGFCTSPGAGVTARTSRHITSHNWMANGKTKEHTCSLTSAFQVLTRKSRCVQKYEPQFGNLFSIASALETFRSWQWWVSLRQGKRLSLSPQRLYIRIR